MIPKTISASSLQVADGCLARYHAENILFTNGPDTKDAARLGTACHFALEKYVEAVYMNKSQEPNLDLLIMFYNVGFVEQFSHEEVGNALFKDGDVMLRDWFQRTDLTGREIISVEKKTRYPVPSSQGDIPLTYIWDRCDRYVEDGRTIVEVVDYKTIRANVTPEELRTKLQARIYGLMARVQFKGQQVDEFRVTFDLLRYGRVTVSFDAEEDAATWRGVLARLERILATPADRAPRTINADCGYCVIKAQCPAIRKNIDAGGFFSIDDIRVASERRFEAAAQIKALEGALAELDTFILRYAQDEDLDSFEEGEYAVKVGMRRTRTIDPKMAARILGDATFARYGKLGISDIDKLLKGDDISPEQKVQLRDAIGIAIGKASVSVTRAKK